MTEDNTTRSNLALSRFFLFIFRLILVILTATVLGAGIYFGFQFVYRDMIKRPIDDNATRIAVQETLQAKNAANERVNLLNDRLSDIEMQQEITSEEVAELNSNFDTMQTLFAQQTEQISRLEELESALDEMLSDIEGNEQKIIDLQSTPEVELSPLTELQQEIWVLQAMELISRSRLYLLQNNLGLAIEDLQNTRAVLVQLQNDLPRKEKNRIAPWIERLDLAIDNLPDSPVLAADDLEIAWRMIVADIVPGEFLRNNHGESGLQPSQTAEVEYENKETTDDSQEEGKATPSATPKP